MDASSPLPLVGALLIAEGYLTPWHAEVCLLLQQHDYPLLDLGEIALQCGYISASNLDHVQQLEQDLRAALTRAVETQAPIPADLNVLIITQHPIAVLTRALARLGATVRYAPCPPAQEYSQAPDLILIDPARLPWCSTMPTGCLVALLPPELHRQQHLGTAPLGMHQLLEAYVRQARDYRSLQVRQVGPAATSPYQAGTESRPHLHHSRAH